MNWKILVVVLGLSFAARAARAESCLPFLTNQANVNSGQVVLVTMNDNSVVSYAIATVELRKRPPDAGGGASWVSRSLVKQLFSDRNPQQPFDLTKADALDLWMNVAESPTITMTLKSWGNVQSTFQGTCTADGIIHGTAPRGAILLRLTQASNY
jgi:hypothetical protein